MKRETRINCNLFEIFDFNDAILKKLEIWKIPDTEGLFEVKIVLAKKHNSNAIVVVNNLKISTELPDVLTELLKYLPIFETES